MLSILEAGIERFAPDQYPATLHPMLVFRVTFEPGDFGETHIARVSVSHADGERIADIGVELSYEAPPEADPRLSYYTIVIQQVPLQVRKDGLYALDLTLDAEPARRIPFLVESRFPQA